MAKNWLEQLLDRFRTPTPERSQATDSPASDGNEPIVDYSPDEVCALESASALPTTRVQIQAGKVWPTEINMMSRKRLPDGSYQYGKVEATMMYVLQNDKILPVKTPDAKARATYVGYFVPTPFTSMMQHQLIENAKEFGTVDPNKILLFSLDTTAKTRPKTI